MSQLTGQHEDMSIPPEEGHLLRTEGGRTFNTLNDAYTLPSDVDEWDRLNGQHKAICIGLGGLYPAPEVVRAILAPQDGITKRTVDLGCGTGIWATEMAREFPHCEVLGVDLVPVPTHKGKIPSNCRFEIGDFALGLPHLHEQCDIVFARAIGLGVKDARKTLGIMEACTKPGGALIWIAGDYDLYSGRPPVYRPFWSTSNPGGSHTQRLPYELRRVSCLGGSDLMTMETILEGGFWSNSSLLDPNSCKTASIYLPLGLWREHEDQALTEQLDRVGLIMQRNLTELFRAMQGPLLKLGWPQETIDGWVAGMKEEFKNSSTQVRFRIAWGRRRGGLDLPTHTLAMPTSHEQAKYPFYEVYSTQEEAIVAKEIRDRGKGIPSPPLASEATRV